MLRNLQEVVAKLKGCESVVGITRYGGRRADDMSPGGDFDLFVLVKERPVDVESLHFYVGEVPVDLNLRTLEDLERSGPLTGIDVALSDGEVLYDETGALSEKLADVKERWKEAPSGLAEHEVQMNRFCQQHVLDKVKGRLKEEPLLCEFLLATNIYWLVQTYFRIRRTPYPGEKAALKWLELREPEVYAGIRRFYAARHLEEKIEISERLTEMVLAPIGGPWSRGELLAFGTTADAKDLQRKGREFFAELFEMSVEDALEGNQEGR